MKITTLTLLKSFKAFNALMDQTCIPASVAFSLARAGKVLMGELETYEKLQNNIRDEFGVRANGELVTLPNGTTPLNPEGQKKLTDLQAVEIDLALDKLSYEQLGKPALSPNQILALDWLIII